MPFFQAHQDNAMVCVSSCNMADTQRAVFFLIVSIWTFLTQDVIMILFCCHFWCFILLQQWIEIWLNWILLSEIVALLHEVRDHFIVNFDHVHISSSLETILQSLKLQMAIEWLCLADWIFLGDHVEGNDYFLSNIYSLSW